jgi:allantoin racemase
MKLLVINPVGHTTWDEQDKRIYESYAPPNSEITVVSLAKGPRSVETARAHRQVIPSVIEIAEKMSQGFDAVIVNCYLDPAVDALKKTLATPVVGPCEASLAVASVIGTRIGVVTVQGEALSMIRSRVRKLDRHKKVISVTGIPMGVLDLNEDLNRTKYNVIQAGQGLREKRRVDVICLGCTGLGGLAGDVQEAVEVPVIDPVCAAVELAGAAVDLNLYSSRPSPMQRR